MKTRILLIFISLSTLAFGQTKEGKYSSKNFNTWSLGIDVGNVYVLGDLSSFASSKTGFELGFSGNLTKSFTSGLGLKAQVGAGNLSGSHVEDDLMFEGDYKTIALMLQLNLSNLTLTGRKVDRGVGILLDLGVGGISFKSSKYNLTTGDFIESTGVPAGSETRDWYMTAGLMGKFRLTEKVSFTVGSQANILIPNDQLDAVTDATFNGNQSDMYFYSYMGFSINLGEKRQSLEWTNPLDEMALEVEEISEKIEGMTNDMDNDGVVDAFDEDNYTPEGVFVDTKGRARDVDGDGVPDHLDLDPFSRKGAEVDENGREIDSDGDGVPDSQDLEPNTAPGALVNFQGKSIAVAMGGPNGMTGSAGGAVYLPSIYFETGKHFVTYANYERIAAVAKVLKANPNIRMRVIGHTDKNGTEESNITLGEKRAQAVVDHLIDIYGVDPSQVYAESKGEFELISNKVDEVNRRVDFVIIPPQ